MVRSLFELFWVFFKIGAFTFGGGLAMLPLIQREVVESKKWLGETEILDVFAVAQSAPGVIAVNTAIFVGTKRKGLAGALAATLGMVLPSFICIIAIVTFLQSLGDNPVVARVFEGVRASSAALILLSAIKLGKKAVTDKPTLIVAFICFVLIAFFDLSAVFAIIIGAAYGVFIHIKTGRARG